MKVEFEEIWYGYIIWKREIENDLINNGIEINPIGINLIYSETGTSKRVTEMERYCLDKSTVQNIWHAIIKQYAFKNNSKYQGIANLYVTFLHSICF